MSEAKVINWMLSKIQTVSGTLKIGSRIYPDKAPKGTLNPCLVFQTLGGENPELADCGPVGSGTFDFQLRFYAGQRYLATQGREALRLALQNVEPVEFDGIRIEGTSYGNAGDTFEEEREDYGANCLVVIHWATAASG